MPSRRRRRLCLLVGLALLLVGMAMFGVLTQLDGTSDYDGHAMTSSHGRSSNRSDSDQPLRRLTCVIDDALRVPCIRHGHEHFLPFSAYLEKRFDLSGHAEKNHFHVHTSYAKIRAPNRTARPVYDPVGPFFEQFNKVALRSRVCCLDPVTGVPMSTQWAPEPYFYPIQILQFGLEHYNRHIETGKAEPVVHSLAKQLQSRANADLLELDDGEEVQLVLQHHLPVLRMSLGARSAGANFVVEMDDRKSRRSIELHFRHSARRDCMWREPRKPSPSADLALSFVYSLGPAPAASNSSFMDLVLDLPIYVAKALALLCKENGEKSNTGPYSAHECQTWKGVDYNDFAPRLLRLRGPCMLRVPSARQQNSAHREQFLQVVRWLLAHQDAAGGWQAPVRRTILPGRLVLPAGWHSAMAQGHALSVLTRAQAMAGAETDDTHVYARTARRALALFNVSSADGGVRATLFGHPWYEEYPVSAPASGTFVLNGFMYALLGLHDASSRGFPEARALFREGMRSLRALLPLFDTGQRTLYDLRHVGVPEGGATAPNVARWDYHRVHVNQLRWLHSVTGDRMLEKFAARWAGYARGAVVRPQQHN